MELNSGIYWDPREPIPPGLMWRSEVPSIQVPTVLTGRGPSKVFSNFEISGYDNLQQHRDIPQSRQFVGSLPKDNFLPPLQATIQAQIVQDTAKVTVTQLFSNESSSIIPKASYTFPLPSECTVTDFVCRIGKDNILKSQIKPQEEAIQSFKDAVKRDESAALLEQKNVEIFTTTLGMIPAHTRLKVEISFISLLKYRIKDNCGLVSRRRGLTTFTLPIYIAPRFGSPPPGMDNALHESRKLRSLKLDIDVLSLEPINSIYCDTHATTIRMGAGSKKCQSWEEFSQSGETDNSKSALICLDEAVTHLDRDFVLNIETRLDDNTEQPQACIETHPELKGHRAIMLTIPSDFMLRNGSMPTNSTTSEIIFLADRSGSMNDKISVLRSAMQFFLKGIPTNRFFNIWSFGSQFESLWPQSCLYSERSLQEALNYVESYFHPNMGGTELLPALEAIVAARGSTHTVDIVVLTDGEVWRLDETLNFVENTRTKSEGMIRFFCLGIGAAVSHALVEGIGNLGGGYAEVIPLASQRNWESHVVQVLKAALTDHMGSFEIQLQGQQKPVNESDPSQKATQDVDFNNLQNQPMMRSPIRDSELNTFSRNRVFMLFEILESEIFFSGITIQVKRPGEKSISVKIPVKHLKLRDTTIHKLAAGSLLKDLERRETRMNPRNNILDPCFFEHASSTRREGERLGCKWSLVSKWTSFVALEEFFRADDLEHDPFIDNEGFAEITSQDSLNLLRPRDREFRKCGLPLETDCREQADAGRGFSRSRGSIEWCSEDWNSSESWGDITEEINKSSANGRPGASDTVIPVASKSDDSEDSRGTGTDDTPSSNNSGYPGDLSSEKPQELHYCGIQVLNNDSSSKQLNLLQKYRASYSGSHARLRPLEAHHRATARDDGLEADTAPRPRKREVAKEPLTYPPSVSDSDPHPTGVYPQSPSTQGMRNFLRIQRPPASSPNGSYNGPSAQNMYFPTAPPPSAYAQGSPAPPPRTLHRRFSTQHSYSQGPPTPPSGPSYYGPVNPCFGIQSPSGPPPDTSYNSSSTRGSNSQEPPATPPGASYQNASYQNSSYQNCSYQNSSYQNSSYQNSSYQGPSTQGIDNPSPIVSSPNTSYGYSPPQGFYTQGPSVPSPGAPHHAPPTQGFCNQSTRDLSYPPPLAIGGSYPMQSGTVLSQEPKFLEYSDSIRSPDTIISEDEWARVGTFKPQAKYVGVQHNRAVGLGSFNVVSGPSGNNQTIKSRAPTTPESKQYAFISRLLKFQSYDGSFVIPDNEAAEIFGNTFLEAARQVGIWIEQKCQVWGSPKIQQLALAASVIALLETQLLSQKPLWTLLADKAKSFIKNFLDVEAVVVDSKADVDAIIENAKESIADKSIDFGVESRHSWL